jgi:hypothetical protein
VVARFADETLAVRDNQAESPVVSRSFQSRTFWE